MGYNSVAVILNDALGAIAEDQHFGRRVSEAVSAWLGRDGRQSLSACAVQRGAIHSGALKVISQDHADGEQVVIVHGNTGKRCQDANDLGWRALDVMKEALERHGYKVTKPRKPKAPSSPVLAGGA